MKTKTFSERNSDLQKLSDKQNEYFEKLQRKLVKQNKKENLYTSLFKKQRAFVFNTQTFTLEERWV